MTTTNILKELFTRTMTRDYKYFLLFYYLIETSVQIFFIFDSEVLMPSSHHPIPPKGEKFSVVPALEMKYFFTVAKPLKLH